ncbi:MAG: TfoX/Sxy family protein [Pseudomonadota bacterium]|nr:TfoX/Sxy family protein [Pseudomonadota bacterium]
MAVDEGLVAWVEEAMVPIGAVTRRAMMGGATLYCDGTIFAIIADGQMWFKADAETDAIWDATAAERFTFTMREGRTGSMNYRRAPDECYDDPGTMREWASLALAAGARAPVKPKRPRKN